MLNKYPYLILSNKFMLSCCKNRAYNIKADLPGYVVKLCSVKSVKTLYCYYNLLSNVWASYVITTYILYGLIPTVFYYLRKRIRTEVMYAPCSSVCLLAGWLDKLWTDLDEIWWEGSPPPMDHSIICWWWSGT